MNIANHYQIVHSHLSLFPKKLSFLNKNKKKSSQIFEKI